MKSWSFTALVLLACSGSSQLDAPLLDDAGNPILADGAIAADGAIKLPDGAVITPDAATPFNPTTKVRIIVEPTDGGAAMVAAIKGATASVHMTMYLLTSTEVINALVAQKKAGRDVKVVLNQNNTGSTNLSAYNTLKSAGVGVVWAPPNFNFTHEKTFIIDTKEAWIMTMNATQSSPTSNREYLAIDDEPADVAEAEAIFQADFANKGITPTGTLVVSPINSRNDLVALANLAKSTIDIEAEEMSDAAFVAALVAAEKRGVKVRVVLSDAPPLPMQPVAVANLKQAGASVVQLSNPYMHAKSMAVDGTYAFVGSENFSAGSLGYNREVGVIFGGVSEVAKVQSTTAKDFAAGTPL